MPYHDRSTRWCPRYRGPLARLPKMEYSIADIQTHISDCHISTVTTPKFWDQKTNINCDWSSVIDGITRITFDKYTLTWSKADYVASISKREVYAAPFYSWETHAGTHGWMDDSWPATAWSKQVLSTDRTGKARLTAWLIRSNLRLATTLARRYHQDHAAMAFQYLSTPSKRKKITKGEDKEETVQNIELGLAIHQCKGGPQCIKP